ncbi:MAG: hypothetical protein M1818_008407 [Claussenomyces sp. TS43310]|nr:MAG: hypothetical protein M1818_008407 [Claussenomyces sp. TS43310]
MRSAASSIAFAFFLAAGVLAAPLQGAALTRESAPLEQRAVFVARDEEDTTVDDAVAWPDNYRARRQRAVLVAKDEEDTTVDDAVAWPDNYRGRR